MRLNFHLGGERTPVEVRFVAKYRVAESGCWLWVSTKNPGGYGLINSGGKNGRMLLAHRLSFALATGREPTGFVLHSCDTPACVNPEHLREGTQADNANDVRERKRGRHPSKIARHERDDVRKMASAGFSQKEIASAYGVSQSLVSRIVTGKGLRQWQE